MRQGVLTALGDDEMQVSCMRTFLIISLSLLLGCGRREPESTVTPPQAEPVSLAESFINEVVPTADGGAYVLSYPGGLWYARDGQAVKVSFKETERNSSGHENSGIVDLEIVPTADGGAYATETETGKGVWYLREASAVRVIEGPLLTSPVQNSSSRDKYFSLYIAELKRHRASEQREERYTEEPEEEREY